MLKYTMKFKKQAVALFHLAGMKTGAEFSNKYGRLPTRAEYRDIMSRKMPDDFEKTPNMEPRFARGCPKSNIVS